MGLLSQWDTSIESLLGVVKNLPTLDPLARHLAQHRQSLAQAIAHELLPKVRLLWPGVKHYDAAAVAYYDAWVADALAELRTGTAQGMRSLLSHTDRYLYRNANEHLDAADFPHGRRIYILDVLHRFNHHVGSYERWLEALLPLIERAEKNHPAPIVVHDLAAGHGGFSIYAKQHLGTRVEMIASDVADEYLDIGRELAADQKVDVTFVVQDATRLASQAAESPPDIYVCTQSVHHFAPGMVARMMGEAAAHARGGICVIDGERGVLPLLFMTPLMAAYGRDWPVVHDTFTSIRRMFYAEELWLLARLAPGADDCEINAGRLAPGHGIVTLRHQCANKHIS